MEELTSLFANFEEPILEEQSVQETTLNTKTTPKTKSQIDVVRTQFLGVETLNWKSLFEGFNTIHAITYSSDINFIYQLIDMFQTAEIIFGCEAVMSFSLQEIMAYQTCLIEKMRDKMGANKEILINRISDETLRFYVTRNRTSHQKIYLLSAEDGRKRVIYGSANLSFTAFSGKQLENICYCDDDTAYTWYMSLYTELKNECTDNIIKKALLLTNEDDAIKTLETLPVIETVEVKKVLMIEPIQEIKNETIENIQFAIDVQGFAKKYATCVPKAEKKGMIILDPIKTKIIHRQFCEELNIEKKSKKAYPQLRIDIEKNLVELNDTKIHLEPTDDEIKNDVKLFLHYMSGYNNFHGDYEGLQARYFEFANWFFCSPFMASMRNIAVRYNQNLLPYPVFGLLYGQSKAGKTSFLETLLKMMIGQKTKMSAPDFTRSTIEGIKRNVQGAPVIVDDLTNSRFNTHAIETIKNDDFGINENLIYYPAIVISANEDVKAVAPEVIRRTIICRVQAGLTNTEVMRSSIVRTIQRDMGTAFYREYLKRMLAKVPELVDELKSDETESAPDILSISSQIIVDIFNEFSEEPLPFYIRHVTLEDYFSEQVTGKFAIKTVQNAWRINKKAFQISEAANELRFNAGDNWEADRIRKELPETLEAHKSGNFLVMNLIEARKFFKINFKKSFFERIGITK